MLRARLAFPEAPTSALDPCCGTGAALHALTAVSNTTTYGVELDANRAASAKGSGIQTIQGNVFEDRKSTRLNFSHLGISYAVFCLQPLEKGWEISVGFRPVQW